MPLYDFRCSDDKCGKEFEEKVSLTEFETKIVSCPECKAKAERQLTGQRIHHTSWKNWRL